MNKISFELNTLKILWTFEISPRRTRSIPGLQLNAKPLICGTGADGRRVDSPKILLREFMSSMRQQFSPTLYVYVIYST